MNDLEQVDTNIIEFKSRAYDQTGSLDLTKIDLTDLNDPLEDLLTEFDHVEDKDFELENEQREYIFHLENYQAPEFSSLQSPLEMSQAILEKLKRTKEDVKRIKYYLDEFNFED